MCSSIVLFITRNKGSQDSAAAFPCNKTIHFVQPSLFEGVLVAQLVEYMHVSRLAWVRFQSWLFADSLSSYHNKQRCKKNPSLFTFSPCEKIDEECLTEELPVVLYRSLSKEIIDIGCLAVEGYSYCQGDLQQIAYGEAVKGKWFHFWSVQI